MRQRLGVLALLAGGTMMWGAATPARANFQVNLTVDGGPSFTVINDSSTTASATFTGNIASSGIINTNTTPGGGTFFLDLRITTNDPGTPTLAKLLSGTSDLVNNDLTAAHTITISISDTGFMQPVTSPDLTMLSHVSDTVITGSADSKLSFQSIVDANNGQNPTSGTWMTATQGLDITNGSDSNDAFKLITTLNPPYSMTSNYTITLGASANGSDPTEINSVSSLTLRPVPDPTSMALSLTALPILGIARRLRRRAAAA